MVAVGFLILVGAGFLALMAFFLRSADCNWDSSSECSTQGLVQLWIALAGLGPALATFVETIRHQGHPRRWFFGTAAIYLVWFLVVIDSA